jgi:hypothetical protein
MTEAEAAQFLSASPMALLENLPDTQFEDVPECFPYGSIGKPP